MTKAYRAGVRLYGTERFTVGSTKPEKAVRLSVNAPETKEQLEKAVIILKKLLEENENRMDLLI